MALDSPMLSPVATVAGPDAVERIRSRFGNGDAGIATRISGLAPLDSAEVPVSTAVVSRIARITEVVGEPNAVLARAAENAPKPVAANGETGVLTTAKTIQVITVSGVLFALLSFAAAKISRLG